MISSRLSNELDSKIRITLPTVTTWVATVEPDPVSTKVGAALDEGEALLLPNATFTKYARKHSVVCFLIVMFAPCRQINWLRLCLSQVYTLKDPVAYSLDVECDRREGSSAFYHMNLTHPPS